MADNLLGLFEASATLIENVTGLNDLNTTLHGEEVGATQISLGPRMGVFMKTCLEADRVLFSFKWATGSIAALLTCAIWWRTSMRNSKAPPSMRRIYYQRVSWFAPVLGVTAVGSIFTPRIFSVAKFLQVQFEAVALAAFGAIVLLLLASEAQKDTRYNDKSVAAQIMIALNKDGPKKFFAVPPFGCCFKACIPSHPLRPAHVLLSRFFVRQYMFTAVIGSLLTLWCALAMASETFQIEQKWVGKLIKLSGFCCIYGLFIMYHATHELLAHWNVTMKFISLKLIVLLSTLQELLIGWVVSKMEAPSKDCLADPFHPSKEVQNKHREHFNCMWLTALESVLVALLVARAFPTSELYNIEGESTTQYVEMQLDSMVHNEERDYETCEDSESESEVE